MKGDEQTMTHSTQIMAFWQAYLDSLPAGQAHPPAQFEAWHFCSNQADADELGALALAGVKTATASLRMAYRSDEPLPQVGGLSIITDWVGAPLLLVETSEMEILPFGEVGARQAYDEGEGDRSLAYWREVHWRIFSEEARGVGREPSEDMAVICEHFKVLWKA
jgi:uncharacterized protein YhfF